MCPRPGLLVLFPSWLAHSVIPLDPIDDELAAPTDQMHRHSLDGQGQAQGAPMGSAEMER